MRGKVASRNSGEAEGQGSGARKASDKEKERTKKSGNAIIDNKI